MVPEVQQAVERVYAAFANVRPGGKIDYYPLWKLTDDEERTLLGAPLRTLPSALVGKYVKAVTAFGRPSDHWWTYYLPRVIELVAQFDWPHPYGAYAALSLLHGTIDSDEPRWRDELDPAQVAALDQFAGAFWRALIGSQYHCITEYYQICSKHTGDAGVRELAEMFVDAGFPVQILLDAFNTITGETPDVWLAAFVNAIIDEDSGEVDFDTTCGLLPRQVEKVCASWAASAALGERMTQAFFRETRPREQGVISRAEERLRRARG